MLDDLGKQMIADAKEEWAVYLATKSDSLTSIGMALYAIGMLLRIRNNEDVIRNSKHQEEADGLIKSWEPVVSAQIILSFMEADNYREADFLESHEESSRAKTARLAIQELELYPSWESWSVVSHDAKMYAEKILSKWRERYCTLESFDILTLAQQLEKSRRELWRAKLPADDGSPFGSLTYEMSPHEVAEWERRVFVSGVAEATLFSSVVTLAWNVRESKNLLRIASEYLYTFSRFRECHVRAKTYADRRVVRAIEESYKVCLPVIVEKVVTNLRAYSDERRAMLFRMKSAKRQLASANKTRAELEKFLRQCGVMPSACQREIDKCIGFWRDQALILEQSLDGQGEN